jgi:hypothetical protein
MLIRRLKYTAVLLLNLGFLPQTAVAQEPATVSVRVEFVLDRYRDRFPDRQAVEAKAAELFAGYLTREVGFLRFAVNDSAPAYRLSFLLDRMDRNTTSFVEVGFWVRLERPNDPPVEKYWLPLRTADQWLAGVGSEAGFLAEIGTKLAHQDAKVAREEILRWVPIADVGLPHLSPLGLVLPFRLLDLCMKNQSVVEFVAEIRGPITQEEQFKAQVVGNFMPTGQPTPEIEPFLGGGFARIIELGSPDDLTPSITQKTVTVKRIFVISYLHDPTACSNRTPRAVGAGTP